MAYREHLFELLCAAIGSPVRAVAKSRGIQIARLEVNRMFAGRTRGIRLLLSTVRYSTICRSVDHKYTTVNSRDTMDFQSDKLTKWSSTSRTTGLYEVTVFQVAVCADRVTSNSPMSLGRAARGPRIQICDVHVPNRPPSSVAGI